LPDSREYTKELIKLGKENQGRLKMIELIAFSLMHCIMDVASVWSLNLASNGGSLLFLGLLPRTA
jgi:hypothetical protein